MADLSWLAELPLEEIARRSPCGYRSRVVTIPQRAASSTEFVQVWCNVERIDSMLTF